MLGVVAVAEPTLVITVRPDAAVSSTPVLAKVPSTTLVAPAGMDPAANDPAPATKVPLRLEAEATGATGALALLVPHTTIVRAEPAGAVVLGAGQAVPAAG